MYSDLLRLTVAVYGLAAAAQLGSLYSVQWRTAAFRLSMAAWFLHTVTVATGVITMHRAPFYTTTEAMAFFLWLLMANYAVLDAIMGFAVLGVFVVPLGFLLMLAIAPGTDLTAGLWPGLKAAWVAGHVSITVLSYVGFTVAFVASLMYLLAERDLKGKVFGTWFRRLPPLEQLDRLSLQAVSVAMPLFALGLTMGTIWARVVWGSFWNWQPKETWSLVVFAVYAAYLWGRLRARWGGTRGAWLNVVGFVTICINVFIVNSLAGPHHF